MAWDFMLAKLQQQASTLKRSAARRCLSVFDGTRIELQGPLRNGALVAMVGVLVCCCPATTGAEEDGTEGKKRASAADVDSTKAAQIKQRRLGLQMVLIPSGVFTMGMNDEHLLKLKHKHSAYQREIHDYVETPSFPVRLTKPFRISAREISVSQFRQFVEESGYVTDAERAGEAWSLVSGQPDDPLGRFQLQTGLSWRNPGFPQTDSHPVTCVSWHDATAFCRWLSKEEGVRFRLPTEAEWEYACRAGSEYAYSCGPEPDRVYEYGNVADAALYRKLPEDVLRQRVLGLDGEGDGFVFTAPVGSFSPNAWQLYDMHGNVWEWCSDRYSDRIYKELRKQAVEEGAWNDPHPIVDPQGPETTPQHEHGDWRSLRGGSWYVAPLQARCSVRAFAESHDAFSYIGFRVVEEVQ